MLKIYWVFVLCVALIEACDFVYFNFIHSTYVPAYEYALTYLVFPASARILLGAAASAAVAYLNKSRPVTVAYVLMLATAACVTMLVTAHYTVSVVFISFALPTVLSLLYSDRRLTLVYSALSLSAYLLIVFFYLPTRPAGTYKHDFIDVLSTLAIIIFLIAIGIKITAVHSDLTARIIEKTISQVALEHMVKEDPLTKLYNHSVFYDSLDMAIISFREINICFCLSVLDIDDFKSVNDRYGHAFGDQVILRLVDLIRASTGENDLAFRYGGEEFAIISFRPLDETVAVGEKIREAFASALYDNNPDVRCTVSIGVNVYSSKFMGKREFFSSADAALYRAKKSGKNKVEVATDEDSFA